MALFQQTNKAPCCLACKIRARRAAAAAAQQPDAAASSSSSSSSSSISSAASQPQPAVEEDESGLPHYTPDRPPAYTPRRIVVRTIVNGGSSTRLTFATVDPNPAPPPDYMDLHAQLTAKCSYTGPSGSRLGGGGR